jgi:hypothetical protein
LRAEAPVAITMFEGTQKKPPQKTCSSSSEEARLEVSPHGTGERAGELSHAALIELARRSLRARARAPLRHAQRAKRREFWGETAKPPRIAPWGLLFTDPRRWLATREKWLRVRRRWRTFSEGAVGTDSPIRSVPENRSHCESGRLRGGAGTRSQIRNVPPPAAGAKRSVPGSSPERAPGSADRHGRPQPDPKKPPPAASKSSASASWRSRAGRRAPPGRPRWRVTRRPRRSRASWQRARDQGRPFAPSAKLGREREAGGVHGQAALAGGASSASA